MKFFISASGSVCSSFVLIFRRFQPEYSYLFRLNLYLRKVYPMPAANAREMGFFYPDVPGRKLDVINHMQITKGLKVKKNQDVNVLLAFRNQTLSIFILFGESWVAPVFSKLLETTRCE